MSHRRARPPIKKIVVAAVVGLNVVVFGGLAVAGVPLFHFAAGGAAAGAKTAAAVPSAATVVIPASTLVRTVLDGPIRGARPAGAAWASSGTPFDKVCADRSAPAPVVSFARPFHTAGGTVSVQLSVYGAGQGTSALVGLAARLRQCPAAGTYGSTAGPTSTAVAAWSQSSSSDASTLMWNRSDVVASVTVARSGASGLASVAESVDASVVKALLGTCSSAVETVADAGRSPWSGKLFTGDLVPQPVVLTYPNPSQSPTPVVPSGVPLVPVPAPTATTPSLAALPTDAPVADIPAPTPPVVTPAGTTGPAVPVSVAPVPPVAASSPATSVQIQQQVADPTGPGCGWAFTMQGSPVFDSAAAQAQFSADAASAQQQLQQTDAAWQQERATYAVSYATYLRQVEAFAQYVQEQNDYVARVLDLGYSQLLADYNAAVATRAAFDSARQAAQDAYDQAVAQCAEAGSPTPTASPTDSSTPVDTATASPSATPTQTAACPPVPPAILSQPEPTVPPSPSPPR